jgi:hypothetical protein
MSTGLKKSSAHNSRLPPGMHTSASELMMKHARKEQMLVAEVSVSSDQQKKKLF